MYVPNIWTRFLILTITRNDKLAYLFFFLSLHFHVYIFARFNLNLVIIQYDMDQFNNITTYVAQ